MTKSEYSTLQSMFSEKLRKEYSKRNQLNSRESEYERAILACKSILSTFYKYNKSDKE